MILYTSGDLFVNRHEAQAFAHGCNCQGVMGAGIALEIRKRYPEVYHEYRLMCRSIPRKFNPGDVFLWVGKTRPSVFNLATQDNYGTDGKVYALDWAIEKSLKTMREMADQHHIESIAMPRIGSGLGGLPWSIVKDIIEKVFEDWQGTLIVYEAFSQEE